MKTLSRMLAQAFKPAPSKLPGVRMRGAMLKARKLAATLHVELETTRGESGVNVWPTRNIADDPFEGDHYAVDWEGALQRVQTYAGSATLVK